MTAVAKLRANAGRNRVIHFVPEVTMGNGHKGLAEIAKRKRIPLSSLEPGEFICFVNKRFTAMKLLSAGGKVLIHWRHEANEPLFQSVIDQLPAVLANDDISFAPDIARAIANYYLDAKDN